MSSAEVKELMMDRFSGFGECVAAAYELPNLNSADFIVVKYNGIIQEYEIKVNRTDLIGEMRCARVAKGLVDASEYYTKKLKQLSLGDKTEVHRELANKHGHGTSLSRTKLEKHQLYLTKEARIVPDWAQQPFVPNTFYWCIPQELLDICKELNEGLPYGIYCYDSPLVQSYNTSFIHKRASTLKPQGARVMYQMANRVHTLLVDARSTIKRLTAAATESDKPSEVSSENSAIGKQAPATPLTIKDELINILETSLRKQGVKKPVTDLFYEDITELTALIQKTCETVIGEDEHHVIVDTGVALDKCEAYKTENEADCNCPAGERNQFRAEQRQTLKDALNG